MVQARAIMVLGTSSGAGKSWLSTALCRWYAKQGLRVAPFKAQNMSNNARVAVIQDAQGQIQGMGEIGAAQYYQALAAGCTPLAHMNPVLLKPEADTASQVIVNGLVDIGLTAMPWRKRSQLLWPQARQGLDRLRREFDLIIIEGAGSPAEINLHDSDFVNMRTALAAQAACVLVCDIDRGGAFAHLWGTHALLPAHEQALIRGFVLNRFRGDAALLAPGPQQLQALTGVPVLGVLPMCHAHGLPEEDGLYERPSPQQGLKVAVVCYPHASNLDEFEALRHLPGLALSWVQSPQALQQAEWVILPGSKCVAADLQWLRQHGLDARLVAHARAGKPLLGICGGMQMLGHTLDDPHGIDGGARGLGLLDLHTRFERDKLVRQSQLQFSPELSPPWSALARLNWSGYEIHHGRTLAQAPEPSGPASATAHIALRDASGQPLGWQAASVLGLYAHGLLQQPLALQALFGQTGPDLQAVFDGLSDVVDRHLGARALWQLWRQAGEATASPA